MKLGVLHTWQQNNHHWLSRLDCNSCRCSVNPSTEITWRPQKDRAYYYPATMTLKSPQGKRTAGSSSPVTSKAVKNPVSSTGRPLKVVGLGTRASSAIQLCLESSLLSSSADLWISSGDTVNEHLFLLLNKKDLKTADDEESRETPIVILVIGMGSNLNGEEASNILRSSRGDGSLSVMIVIQPFNFEGPRRKKEVELLAESLLDHIDLCFVIQHDALFKREKVTLAEALRMADNTVLHAIKAVSNLCLGDQVKVLDAPREGLQNIATSDIFSILRRAGNAWVGFGSSYSIKSAVQRAAFESPFLQGLIPGVKGLVSCTIASREEMEQKDLQAALHTLRCSIGPTAQLICTSVKEPTLRQGVIAATVLFTRIDGENSLSLSLGENSGVHSSSMNGREIRKSVEAAIEVLDGSTNGSMLMEKKGPSNNLVCDQLALGGDHDATGDVENNSPVSADNVVLQHNSNVEHSENRHQGPEEATNVQDDFELSRPMQPELNTGVSENKTCQTSENAILDSSQSGVSKCKADNINNTVPSNKIKPMLDKMDKSNIWKLFNFSSITDRGKATSNGERKSIFGWEAGPNSAAAEAWAQTRIKLGSLGSLDVNGTDKAAFGIRSTGDSKSEFSGEQDKEWDSSYLTGPLGIVLSNSLDAVADIYNAASAKVLKKYEDEDPKQASSFLSQRAAYMLETERTSVQLSPSVEMKYKNGIYRGRCYEGLPEGKGRLTYSDGSFYDGMWKKGKRVGNGSFYYTNGDVFQGNWRDDQMHGKGWLYFHTGERLYSDFWKGKANGEGRYYSARGDVFFGYFRDGWRHGKSLSIENGVRWSEVWEHGVLVSRTRLEDAEPN